MDRTHNLMGPSLLAMTERLADIPASEGMCARLYQMAEELADRQHDGNILTARQAARGNGSGFARAAGLPLETVSKQLLRRTTRPEPDVIDRYLACAAARSVV